jgi:predicted nucleotide-binding protein
MSGPFLARDIGLIVKTMYEDSTIDHGTIGLLLESYEAGEVDGNRKVRLTHLVKTVHANDDGGQTEMRRLLNEVFWEDSESEFRRSLPTAEKLMNRLHELFDVDDDGIPASPTSGIRFAPPQRPAYDQPKATSVATPSALPKQERSIVTQAVTENGSSNNRVFVVHGRDSYAHKQLEGFLRFAGCRILTWNQAKISVASKQPTTLEIVKAGIASSTAVVVLFTPDDVAHVKPEFKQSDDPAHETEPTGQARQNVIFEAGMALAVAPERTLFVRYGKTRKMSDIDGHNWTTLSNEYLERKLLLDELKKVGLDIDDHMDLTDTTHGNFPALTSA